MRGALLLCLVAPAVLLAHGALRSSQPASGARLDAAPTRLRLVFNEAIELAVARLSLTGPDSQALSLGALRQPGDSSKLLVAEITGALRASGAYTVAWEIVGRDGHPVRGTFGFIVAEGARGLVPSAPAPPATADSARLAVTPVAPPPTTEADGILSPLFVAARWMGYAALLAMIGVIMVRFPLLARLARTGAPNAAALAPLEARAAAFGALAAGVMIGAAFLRLFAQARAMSGEMRPLDMSLVGSLVGGTLWGGAWLAQLAAVTLAAAALMLARRGGAGAWVAAAIAIAAVALIQPMFGHAAAARFAPLPILIAGLHIIGAGGWLGALVVLVVVGLPVALRAPRAERGRVASALVDAFSPLALAFAATAAATGAISSWIHLGSIAALFTSGYGRVLMIKLGLLVVVAAIGAYNWRRMKPAVCDEGTAQQLRRSAAAEVVLGALVLAATAVLVATPPPTELMR